MFRVTRHIQTGSTVAAHTDREHRHSAYRQGAPQQHLHIFSLLSRSLTTQEHLGEEEELGVEPGEISGVDIFASRCKGRFLAWVIYQR